MPQHDIQSTEDHEANDDNNLRTHWPYRPERNEMIIILKTAATRCIKIKWNTIKLFYFKW